MGFLLYRLFILILCLALAFGTSLDSEGSDSEIPAPNSPLSLTPKHETAIVAAPDGMIHLLELSLGKILWSFKSGPSIYSSFQALPENHGDDHNSTGGENFYIDCGEDWKLYLHGDNFIKKLELPQSVDEFLIHTPYILAGGVMIRSIKTTAFLVDSKLGRVVMFGDTEDDENPILERNDDLEDWRASSAMDLDLVDNPLHIIRTDYALKYTSTKTEKVLWNLQFADFEVSLQFEENEFGSGHEVCPTRPPMYRIRDRSALESLWMFYRLQKALREDRSIEKLVKFHPNNEGKVVHALPLAPLTGEYAIIDPLAGDNQVVIESFVLFGTLVLLIVAFLFYITSSVKGKWYKLQNQDVDKKLEVMTSKKKKLWKSGINKGSSNIDKGKKRGFY